MEQILSFSVKRGIGALILAATDAARLDAKSFKFAVNKINMTAAEAKELAIQATVPKQEQEVYDEIRARAVAGCCNTYFKKRLHPILMEKLTRDGYKTYETEGMLEYSLEVSWL